MILQSSNYVGLVFGIIGFLIFVLIVLYFKTLVVVPFNQIHVVSKGKKVATYDGRGRYNFFAFIHGRIIIPKHVIDVEPALIKLHDQDKLPFGVEISIKVQVTDPQKAAATLTTINHNTVSKVVEDTVMSAVRSIAMERSILEIMKNREEIEEATYEMVATALSKLGLSAIIFDIKNLRDIEGTDVIASLERVKIAELRKNARISESIHNNQAIEIESENAKKSNVKREQMKLEEERARLNREQETTTNMKVVEEEKLKIEVYKRQKLAEMARDQKLIEAQSQADAIRMKAEAESHAIKMKANAEAETIRLKGIAEAEVLIKKGEAMKKAEAMQQIKMLEILSQAQVESAGKVAEALGANNKIMYIPADGQNSILSSFLPKIDSFLQSGVADEIANLFNGKKGKKKRDSSDSDEQDF